jgi:hypothetical protein
MKLTQLLSRKGLSVAVILVFVVLSVGGFGLLNSSLDSKVASAQTNSKNTKTLSYLPQDCTDQLRTEFICELESIEYYKKCNLDQVYDFSIESCKKCSEKNQPHVRVGICLPKKVICKANSQLSDDGTCKACEKGFITTVKSKGICIKAIVQNKSQSLAKTQALKKRIVAYKK